MISATQRILKGAETVAGAGSPVSKVCRAPEDDRILECALSGQADYLVSGDEDLLVLREFRGVRIPRPRNFELLFED